VQYFFRTVPSSVSSCNSNSKHKYVSQHLFHLAPICYAHSVQVVFFCMQNLPKQLTWIMREKREIYRFSGRLGHQRDCRHVQPLPSSANSIKLMVAAWTNRQASPVFLESTMMYHLDRQSLKYKMRHPISILDIITTYVLQAQPCQITTKRWFLIIFIQSKELRCL
jgi:hypothetical protein